MLRSWIGNRPRFCACVSDSRADRTARHPSGKRVFAFRGSASGSGAVLVRAELAVDLERTTHADGAMLGGPARVGPVGTQSLAARHAGGLFRLLSFLCGGSRRIFRLPIG